MSITYSRIVNSFTLNKGPQYGLHKFHHFHPPLKNVSFTIEVVEHVQCVAGMCMNTEKLIIAKSSVYFEGYFPQCFTILRCLGNFERDLVGFPGMSRAEKFWQVWQIFHRILANFSKDFFQHFPSCTSMICLLKPIVGPFLKLRINFYSMLTLNIYLGNLD